MARRVQTHGIAEEANASSRLMAAVLLVPALISLVLMLFYAWTYSASMTRMETVTSLRPLVNTEIPEETWNAVAGRTSFSQCGAEETIAQVDKALEGLMAQSGSALELTVARRTMDTLNSYVAAIGKALDENRPVVESEATLEEVRSVAALVDDMLEEYITQEIQSAIATNATLKHTVLAAAGLEIALLAVALYISSLARKRLARSIHEPIAQLEHFAGLLAAGNLQYRAPGTDVREMQSLTEQVNVMADKLEELIEQNRREQINLKKAELRTLQAQVNPHFLYNTLDAIVWQAEAGNSAEVIHITRALSDFFRISLSSGADWIPVSQEIRHLSGYLAIQKTRYRDILNYVVDVPEEIGGGYILKLLLQPLVENALYHGIKYRRGGGTITVTGRREGDALRFEVRDTGRGMTPEQLGEVRRRMRDDDAPPRAQPLPDGSGSGFGLRNVDQRIRLYYAQAEGLEIQSGPEGTSVSFRVPVRESAEEE